MVDRKTEKNPSVVESKFLARIFFSSGAVNLHAAKASHQSERGNSYRRKNKVYIKSGLPQLLSKGIQNTETRGKAMIKIKGEIPNKTLEERERQRRKQDSRGGERI